MSVQAMAWALDMPHEIVKSPTVRHVLLCLANYAGQDGRHAFPGVETLMFNTGLSERAVRKALRELEESGIIARGNQAIAAAHIARADQRPVVYDLPLPEGQRPARRAPRTKRKRGAQDAPREEATGCTKTPNGVHEMTERGARGAPDPSYNHQEPGSGPAWERVEGPLREPLRRLESEISPAAFEAWFRQVRVDPASPFTLRAPNAFVGSRISADYLPKLQSIVNKIGLEGRVMVEA